MRLIAAGDTTRSRTPPTSSSRPSSPFRTMPISKVRSRRSLDLNHPIGTSFRSSRTRGAAAVEQPDEQPWILGPDLEQHRTRNAAGRITQQQHHRDNVVQRTDDGEELRDQVDRREHPQDRDEEGDLRTTRYLGSATEPSSGGNARR